MADPVTCTTECTVTVVVTTEPFTAERMQADLWMFGVMLTYLTAVWGAKQLFNLFRTGRYES